MNKSAALLYGVVCYLIFLFTFLYAVGFVGNIVVPKSIDGPAQSPLLSALLVNALLLTIFALQHSIMARPAFKQWWTKFVPQVIERSTYVLFSSLALLILFYYWQPLGGNVWQIENPVLTSLMWLGFAFGWTLVLVSTFLINHFDLFGLRQVWLYYQGKTYVPLPFETPLVYKFLRHPLYMGWFFAFWCTPTMTATHLVFAVTTTIYILVAIRFEEHDLVETFGEKYRRYQQKVPMLIPFFKSKAH